MQSYNSARIFIFLLLIACFSFISKGNSTIPSSYSKNDTIIDSKVSSSGNPSDSIIQKKQSKIKLLSKEGIVYKQIARNSEGNKKNAPDSAANKENYVKNTGKNKYSVNESRELLIKLSPNKNLNSLHSVNLFPQLSDKKAISKLEFLNTIKQLNRLKKEITENNDQQKKTNPVKWLLLLIAAVVIVVILAFFIKEFLTLFLIAFMLVALVLLIGFL
jgi:F0F1-type ATP synthase assembly protein I